MKNIGVIAEYNPLHYGHIHHLDEIKKKNPDIIIGIISSSMTTRGDLSIFDKFIKTKQALEAGIDLVIELPLIYSMQRADLFSLNAVKILNLAKVNEIVIGSEKNDLSIYKEKYELNKNDLDIKKSLKENSISLLDLDSNDTLGYFYYKAIKDNDYKIDLSLIKRINNNYNDKSLNETNIQSASAIRNNLASIDKYTPSFVAKDKDKILDETKLFPILKYKILSLTPNELKEIFFVDEGIEYKLKDIKDYNNFDDFITYLSGKKYTKTRMKRMLMYILFNIKKDMVNNITEPNFIRVLGYNSKGKEYLKNIKKDVLIYTNIKEGINPILDIELKVSKILDSIYNIDLLTLEQKGPITL